MKNSQKGVILPVVIILAVLIIGGGAYYIYNNNHNRPTSYNNSELISTYPVIANEDLWRTKLISSDNPQRWVIPEKNITIQAFDYSGNFKCGNINADFSRYSSYNTGAIGGWNNISVVSCKDYYFVFEYGDAGPKLFGPFDLGTTSTSPQDELSVNIQIVPDRIKKNGSATLTWSSRGAKLCNAYSPTAPDAPFVMNWSGGVELNGSRKYQDIPHNIIWEISCKNQKGQSVSKQARVVVE